MLKIKTSIMLMAGLCVIATQTEAQIYNNGPINGTYDAWTINFGYSVSDSFVPSTTANLTSASIGLWTYPGDIPASVSWEISTGPAAVGTPGTVISSGNNSLLASTLLGTPVNPFGYSLWTSLLGISGGVIGGDTYYFTLFNAAVPSGDPVYWDMNMGPSVCYESAYGNVDGYNGVPGSHSTTFALYGTPTQLGVPDAATTSGLLGMALVGLGAIRRKLS